MFTGRRKFFRGPHVRHLCLNRTESNPDRINLLPAVSLFSSLVKLFSAFSQRYSARSCFLRSVCMAVSCPGGQLTRGQFAAVSCPCSWKPFQPKPTKLPQVPTFPLNLFLFCSCRRVSTFRPHQCSIASPLPNKKLKIIPNSPAFFFIE